MKEKITIENFSNGITLVVQTEDGNIEKKVATDIQREIVIGNTIWSGIKNIIEKGVTDRVTLNIEYTTEE